MRRFDPDRHYLILRHGVPESLGALLARPSLEEKDARAILLLALKSLPHENVLRKTVSGCGVRLVVRLAFEAVLVTCIMVFTGKKAPDGFKEIVVVEEIR